MSQSSGDSYGGAIVLFLVAVCFFGYDPLSTKSVRVAEQICDGSWNDSGICVGKLTDGSEFLWRLNPNARAAEAVVKHFPDPAHWYPGLWYRSHIYKDCAIVTDENWQCKESLDIGVEEVVGMNEGSYFRRLNGHDIRGINGWGYWWRKFNNLGT